MEIDKILIDFRGLFNDKNNIPVMHCMGKGYIKMFGCFLKPKNIYKILDIK